MWLHILLNIDIGEEEKKTKKMVIRGFHKYNMSVWRWLWQAEIYLIKVLIEL